jgi:mycothione reductase
MVMKTYDVVVIGAGDVGLSIAFKASSDGLKVALIDKGPVGGTCINVGCVPSKTLIATADRIAEIREARKLGIQAEIVTIDFEAVMERMRQAVTSGRNSLQEAIGDSKNIVFYNREGHFIDTYTVDVGDQKIRGKNIFIAAGTRPVIPLIKGLDTVDYLTNETLLELKTKPESMIILGGGYIAVEYGHFFSALGTKVTLLQRDARLLVKEEPEISEVLKNELGKHLEIYPDTETKEVRQDRGSCRAMIRNTVTGEEKEISGEKILIATGRTSNADLLKVENAGIETDEAHFIVVDGHLRTNKRNVWALGDIIGRQMFTHAGDKEAEIAWHNATKKRKITMDFRLVPHAVFTYPQIASVGMTEEEARKDHKILVGRANYADTVMGDALAEHDGFAKAIVEKTTGRILGFHIIGPEASILIQEVVNAIANNGDVKSITGSMHIFPALSDLIPEALNNLA